MPYHDGEMGWGAMIDRPEQALVFANAFRAMRWMLSRHAWPSRYIDCFRDGRWRLIPYGGELPLFAASEVAA
jgi:hypothetical protein